MRRGRRAILILAAAAVAVVSVAALGGVGAARSTTPKLVKVCDNYFAPKGPCASAEVGKVRIRKRGRVKWQWGPGVGAHNVTLTRAPNGVKKRKFRSQTQASPAHFTRRFRKPGKYHFICTIHPGTMQMNVIVRRPG